MVLTTLASNWQAITYTPFEGEVRVAHLCHVANVGGAMSRPKSEACLDVAGGQRPLFTLHLSRSEDLISLCISDTT